eukprot:TRINITY_DN382_c0_g1::TRINITY_DN382_c0_g1_i1::g.7571::m.7571 TRINITY_DN382_c0_g1::TRINITY_DN382_c0_g1_i1::g.7571  ORF type:complete len:313 (+),score=17.81,sp/P28563/DUS1_MOUSE/27.84/1e-21,DSPc/PF00782.15/4.2e-35,Rhodanese/PF00581.15/1.9e-05,Rhodanese/PF00581.15/2.3e+02,Y_phosphatase/PF00102.22/4.7e-06,PTPlike_phytase/PF14566.1/4.4e-06,Init_tRNA_PT/PF04179.7/0.0012,Gal-bind_lectin/PF00337.17/0.13,Gal-bind_lectin/PF00337.17/3.8e+03 TRINITY_DN382_c0_g1_i1:81-1019(+)
MESKDWSSISQLDLYNILQHGYYTVTIDAREKEAFLQGHLPRAVSLPFLKLENVSSWSSLQELAWEPSQQKWLRDLHLWTYIVIDGTTTPLDSIQPFAALARKEMKSLQIFVTEQSLESFRLRFPFLSLKGEESYSRISYPNLICEDYLFLGSFRQAMSEAVINDLGITHIVDASLCVDHAISKHPFKKQGVQYFEVPVRDEPDQDIRRYFDSIYQFISDARQKRADARILVHCQAGISRSATLVISYLMREWKMSAQQAEDYVIKRRHYVDPNDGFRSQLRQFGEAGDDASPDSSSQNKTSGLRKLIHFFR